MIQINLLPPEYRPRTGTPVARFVAIVVGIVMALSAGGAYAYTHFIELSKVKELRQSREEEVKTTEMQRDRSLRLQQEIDMYEQRRRAIQTINRSRTLWSRKLDQFFEIIAAQNVDESMALWMDTIDVPAKAATLRRRRPSKRQDSMEPAAQFKFEGFMAMSSNAEAPALLSGFHKAITGDPETTGRPTEFFADFMAINNPNIEMLREVRSGRDEEELVPPRVGAFTYDLALAPVDVDKKKPTGGRR
jgi:cell division protein FtsB